MAGAATSTNKYFITTHKSPSPLTLHLPPGVHRIAVDVTTVARHGHTHIARQAWSVVAMTRGACESAQAAGFNTSTTFPEVFHEDASTKSARKVICTGKHDQIMGPEDFRWL